ncbi:AAA family ATPase [Desulforamulus ruminis]|uniref:ATP-dependent nuclease n=1 Tax=Desulforamulus ruminis TaxID=1564 RepID=UPI002FD8C85C
MKIYLNKICIKNFRCFDDQGIEVIFNKGVNAIIGENNSGKSALIDAIRIAFSTVSYSKDIYFTKSDFYTNSKGERAKAAQFDIYLEEVPTFLIEVWNPESPTTGEFHLRFYTMMTPGGVEKVKYKAWGGKTEGNPLSSETFDAINVAFLGALRDAENEMRPSRSSKLANLLSTITTDEAAKIELVGELLKANKAILSKEPIKKTKEIINSNLLEIEQQLLHQQIDIGLVDPKFDSIASSLRSWIVPRWFFVGEDYPHYATLLEICTVQSLSKLVRNTDGGIYLDINSVLHSGANISEEISLSLVSLMRHSFELYQNGLGYNNLLFMSAVLGDMSLNKSGIHLNLFTIEEPEAHLHPQLQELIHSFFERKHRNSSSSIQVIYTSHSPTLVSRISINSTNLLFEDAHTIRCYPLSSANLEEIDQAYLERYLDVTKSQMFFAKGILFAEGICEAILLPEMAKILNRPFDKFSVEMVNVDGTSFRPFAKILTLPAGGKCFAKAAILTDDDRCTDKDDQTTYIEKDLDFDDDLTGIFEKIQSGRPSARFKNISELCASINVELCGATKTLEFELALQPNNVPYLLDAINSEFPQVGVKLKTLVDAETTLENKALRIWLFIRARNNSKGQVAQSLCRALQKQSEDIQNGVKIEKPFIVPLYIAKAIYAVTEPEG